jgi:hypothetical protein
MHIELTEMLRCPEPHEQQHLVLSTGEMKGRMVRSGILGCPVCQREFRILNGVVDFAGQGTRDAGHGTRDTGTVAVDAPAVDTDAIQAMLDLSGPGGIVALVGEAVRHAPALAGLMEGVHFVGTNAPAECEECTTLSLVSAEQVIPLRDSTTRGVLIGADFAREPWLTEAHRVLLRGRRWVAQASAIAPPAGITQIASSGDVVVGEKR